MKIVWTVRLHPRDIALQVSDGSLYPALHKLEQQGWITAEWRTTENNRRAKIYALTPPGRRYLGQETANWERLSQAITHVVRLTEALGNMLRPTSCA